MADTSNPGKPAVPGPGERDLKSISEGGTNLEPLNFKGLSLLEMSQQLSSIESSPTREEPLNTSDFFNSQGELILSGMSEWSSDSDREPDDDLLPSRVEEVKSDDENSDGSTASTESISAYQPSAVSSGSRTTGENEGEDEDASSDSKPLKNVQSSSASASGKRKPKNKSVRFGHSHVGFGVEPSLPTKTSQNENPSFKAAPTEEYFWSEPVKDDDAEPFKAVIHNVPNYGVRVYPGLHGLNVMNTSKTSGWRILPGTENEQITQRAPNFRTPGGYKPPLEEKEPRNLSNSEIMEEVRQMYAEDAERELELESQIIVATSQDEDQLEITNHFLKRKPPVKRKLFKADDETGGSGDAAATAIKDGDQSGDSKLVEVIERPAVKGHNYLCGGAGDHSAEDPKPSPLDSVRKVHFTGDISRCLPRQPRNKNKDLSNTSTTTTNSPGLENRKSNLAALDKLWRDIQETKQHMEADMRSRMKTQDVPISELTRNVENSEPSPSIASTSNTAPGNSAKTLESPVKLEASNPNVVKRHAPVASKVHRRRGGKQIRAPSRASGKSIGVGSRQKRTSKIDFDIDALNADLESLEISNILQEAQLEESDLDDILSGISHFPVPGQLFDESEAPVELTSALQQLQITDWAKAGANEYVDKFHEEKYKRQQCEKEILQVQKELLEQRERIAVLEGLLKSKETAVSKSTNLWEALVRKWKSHESKCKKTIADFEAKQKELESDLKDRKARLGEYEAELGKAVQLTEEFKITNDELVKEIQDGYTATELRQTELNGQLEQLQTELMEEKAEKEAMVRALRECQTKLDETKSSLEASNQKILADAKHTKKSSKLAEDLSKENKKLKTKISDLSKSKASLVSELHKAEETIKTERAEKELLEATVKSNLDEKLKEQGNKLHDYYNSRLQEILKTELERIQSAEQEILRVNATKSMRLEEDWNDRLAKTETKLKAEYETLKQQYESEIAELKRENSQKTNLIAGVSRQLQSYENGKIADGVISVAEPVKIDSSKPKTFSKSKSHGHQSHHLSHKGEKVCIPPSSSPPIREARANSPPTASSNAPPLAPSDFDLESAEMTNCITNLVNAYKEKNSTNS